MLLCSNTLKKVISESYRDQGHLKFNITESRGNLDYVSIRSNSLNVNHYYYDESPVTDKILIGDNIATLENSRWLLDGSMHSLYIDNVYKYEKVGNDSNNQHAYNEHSIVSDELCDSSGLFDYAVRVSCSFKSKEAAITDHIKIIWDPILRQAPINYMIKYVWAEINEYLAYVSGMSNSVTWHTNYLFGPTDLCIYSKDFKLDKSVAISSIEISDRSSTQPLRWCTGNSRFRISEIILGDSYDESTEGLNLISCEMNKEISYLNNILPNYTATLTFDNTYRFFDPLQQTGIMTKLYQGMPFILQWGISVIDSLPEDILYAEPERWFIASWECPSDSSEFRLKISSAVNFINTEYFPESFIYHNKLNGVDLKRIPGNLYSIYSWAKDVMSYGLQKSNLNQKCTSILNDANNPFILNNTSGWPLIESCLNILQKLAQCTNSYLSVDTSTGLPKIATIPKTDKITAYINESEIIEHPSITDSNDISKILYKTYLLENTNFTLEVLKKITQDLLNKEVVMDFGVYESEGIKFNVLGLPETYLYNDVNVADFTYYGRQAYFTLQGVYSENAYVGTSIIRPVLESVAEYTYNLKKAGDTLSIDNNFMTDNFINSKYVEYILSIIKSHKNIVLETLGEIYVEPGDFIEANTEYGNFKILVTQSKIKFNGGFSGTIKGLIISNEMDY